MKIHAHHKQRRRAYAIRRSTFIDGPRNRYGRTLTVFVGRWVIDVDYRVRALPPELDGL